MNLLPSIFRTALFSSTLSAIAIAAPAFAQVTTYHYNNARTGATTGETTLTTSNVNVSSFGKLFSLAVDGQIYAQPLYLPHVSISQKGTHNVVYVATEHNSVYAFDADSQGNPLWQVNLGPSVPWAACCLERDLVPEIGITSTPVIDPVAGIIYVVAESWENNRAFFRLHALDVTSGQDKPPSPVVIQGSVPGSSFDSNNGSLSFSPVAHYQRPGLLLANGRIYVGFGSHQDTSPWHGWLFSYDAATLAQTGILCFAPDDEGNGIWQGGVAPAADNSGNVYLESSNGPLDVNTGGRDYGDSVLKIGTSGSGLTVLDYFAPSTQLTDDLQDWDLGSSGPLLIPGTSLGVAGGKDGKLYVFNTAGLGHFSSTTDQVVQEWQATFPYSDQLAGGFFGGSYIFYNSMLYSFGERDSLKAFSFNGSQFNTNPISQSTFTLPSGLYNNPAMSISANGLTSGTGIVWAAFSSDGGAGGGAHPGVFYAFDAADISRVLWNSGQNSARDAVGNWAKWSPPIVANGKVYLATFDNTVNVYGLLSAGQNSIAATAGTGQSTVVNTAFGAALQATVKDPSGNPLSGVTVTFTTPATGAGAAFSGSATATAATNSSGIATAPMLTANGQPGSYAINASAPGVGLPASFSLTNLTGSAAANDTLTAPSTVSLSVPSNATGTQTVTLTYRNIYNVGPAFEAAASSPGTPWLSVSPVTGAMTQSSFDGTTYTYTAQVTITANPGRFSPGYRVTGNIGWTAAGGAASTSVTMSVTDPTNITVAPQSLAFTYRQGDPSAPAVQNISVSNMPAGANFSASASTASGRAWLSVGAGSGTTYGTAPVSVPVSIDITDLSVGTYAGKITISSDAISFDVPVTLTCLPSSSMAISSGGIVPIYSKATSIQAGSWISIYGTNLADTTALWNGDFPKSLGGVSVTINGKAAYLWYVSPIQINLQAPDDTATGSVAVVVTNSHGNFTSAVTLAPESPSFSLLDGNHVAGVIPTSDGTGAYGGGSWDIVGPAGGFPFKTRPVKAGETVELFGVGFGPTNPAVPSGQVFTSDAPAVYPITITIGGVPAAVSFAGITSAGLYQFNVIVPNAGSGDQPLKATVNGVTTLTGPVLTLQ